jgi:hypothetical protein
MARGKYLSLEEARNRNALKRFAKEHPSETDKAAFDDLLGAMIRKKPAGERTSTRDTSAYSSDTRTPRDTSEDA